LGFKSTGFLDLPLPFFYRNKSPSLFDEVLSDFWPQTWMKSLPENETIVVDCDFLNRGAG
jgi:hypothetical protein